MKVVARRREGYVHDVEIEGDHTIVTDEPAAAGGTDTGPSPTRLLGASLASCIAITIEMYAARKGWEIGAVEVEVDVEYEGYAPKAFAATVRLSEDLSEEQRKRLLVIAGKCPVHKVIHYGAPISVSDRVESI